MAKCQKKLWGRDCYFDAEPRSPFCWMHQKAKKPARKPKRKKAA